VGEVVYRMQVRIRLEAWHSLHPTRMEPDMQVKSPSVWTREVGTMGTGGTALMHGALSVLDL